ncbi:iron ABC transporter permease [Agrobacterium sp.]|jgi:iron(III) transport system permease protein|uniref:ABC transporter permease n=1 Tax=Agrobacterium sp. TaxID=361 RepID=UPI0028AC9338
MTLQTTLPEDPLRPQPAWKRLFYLLRVNSADPTLLLALLLLVVFGYLILAPVLLLLVDAVTVHFADLARTRQELGDLTLYYLNRVLLSPISRDLFWWPLAHTAIISAAAIIIAFLVGAPIGWLLSRTDLMCKKWFSTALLVPYMLPSWTFALAWLTLFKNRTTGGQPGWMETLGFTPPDWLAYGALPISLILALHYAPFVILLFGNALKQFDTQLEDSARSLGASPAVVARRIILPLMMPSLVSATTLIFAKCLGDFGVAYVLGVPVGFDVLATSLFRAISTSQAGASAVLAGMIVLLGAISIVIDMRLLKEAKRFVTIGSKGSMVRQTPLGKWQIPALTWAFTVFAISAAIPLIALTLTTVMRVPGSFSLDNFTLDYWIGTNLGTTALHQGILLTGEFWLALWNTVWMVGLAATGAGLLGLLVGYAVVRSPVPFVSVALRQITFLPYLVPGIAFAAAYLSMFAVARPPLPALYGTPIILVLAILADQMPFASRAGISSMMQLGKEPEEAGQIVGAGWFRRMRSIVLPIQRGALVSAILLPFISGIKGLSLVVVLAVPGTDLLTTYAIRLVDYGYSQAANAVVVMLCIVAFTGTMLVQKIGKANLSDGMGSK